MKALLLALLLLVPVLAAAEPACATHAEGCCCTAPSAPSCPCMEPAAPTHGVAVTPVASAPALPNAPLEPPSSPTWGADRNFGRPLLLRPPRGPEPARGPPCGSPA